MNYEDFNGYCRSLKATDYVVQWGNAHVWKVGGKVFAIGGWEKDDGQAAFTFKVSDLNYEILKDEPGFRPAPYMASRGMKWIQQYCVTKTDERSLKQYINDSYILVCQGISKKKRKELGLKELGLEVS